EEGGNSAIARLQLRIGQFRIAPNLLHHAEAPFGKDLPVVNAERPVSVEQSLAAWLMSGTQIYQTGAHGIVPTSLEYRRPARLQWRWQVRPALAQQQRQCRDLVAQRPAGLNRPGSHGHVFGNKVIFQPATEIMMERALARWVRAS